MYVEFDYVGIVQKNDGRPSFFFDDSFVIWYRNGYIR